MPQTGLNAKQRDFVRLYLGRSSRYHGNATACYKKAYECTDDRVAQVCGSRLTKKPHIAKLIAQAKERALHNLGIDAQFVLAESLRLYDRAMGDEPVEVDVIDTVKQADGTVLNVPRTIEVRRYDPQVASKQIEQIGRHTSVQAFQDNVEHTHTHYLEQRLAARHKQIEQRAANRPPIEGAATRIDDDDAPGAGAQQLDQAHEAGAGGEAEKRVHRGGGHDRAAASPAKTARAAAGASGK